MINSAITIAGGGHTISRASGASAFRFFYVATGGTLTLNQLTLTGGSTTSAGAIYTYGTVIINI